MISKGVKRFNRLCRLFPVFTITMILNAAGVINGLETDESVVGHWIFVGLETDASIVPDLSSNKNDGTIYGCQVHEDGVYVNTDDDSIVMPDIDAYNIGGSITIEAWVNQESYPPDEIENDPAGQGHALILFRGDDRPGQDPYFLSCEGNGRGNKSWFHIEVFEPKWQFTNVEGGPIPLGEDIHIVGTLDDATGNQRMYVNGEISAETQTENRPFTYPYPDNEYYHPLVIGNCPINEKPVYRFPFHGTIKEVRLLNRAISESEVGERYAAGPGVVPSSIKKPLKPSFNNSNKTGKGFDTNIKLKNNQKVSGKSFQLLGRKAEEKTASQILIEKPDQNVKEIAH
jgi:hypothetical protein